MRFSISQFLVLALASSATASTWFPGSKTVYNKWHETELERWLSDHDVPYPATADRKDLETLVKSNWQAKVVEPLAGTSDKTAEGYGSVKEWIFDSWTESSLKAFLDHNKIPAPKPRNRDTLLTTARQNYDAIAKKTKEYTAYPGNWLYQSWSESDLKEFLDARGIPVPQPTTRDKLIASVRRNARLASLNMSASASSASVSAASASSVASKSAASAQSSLSNLLYDSWSDSKLKAFLDEHGVPVPQGSKKNEMIALARKYAASATGNAASTVSGSAASAASVASGSAGSAASVASGSAYSGASVASGSAYSGASVASGSAASAASVASGSAQSAASVASGSAASAFGAATSKAGNAYVQATDTAAALAESAFNSAADTWSESRLKAYLDSRGVPVPQGSKKDELLASVRLNRHKAATGWSAWTFDTWTVDNLKKYLETHGKKAKKNANASREELVKQAQDAYASASKTGGTSYASVTSYLAQQTDSAKDTVFDTWSDSQLKDYLDSYGIPNYQGSTTNELRAEAKKQYNYFKYGTSSPPATIFEQLKGGIKWLFNQAGFAAASGSASASKAATSAASRAAASTASVKAEL